MIFTLCVSNLTSLIIAPHISVGAHHVEVEVEENTIEVVETEETSETVADTLVIEAVKEE